LEHFTPEIAVGFDPSLVRRLDYYTGSVFEIYCPETGDFLGGGGRYDGLMGRFGSEEPATGFALNMESVQSAVCLRNGEDDADDLCLILTEPEYPAAAVRLAQELRGRGYAVIVEPVEERAVDPAGRGEALGAATVYVVGDNPQKFRIGESGGDGK
ncbi:MAG: ATP phosphoribosyltransferase regulatory subunit, partial [Clostridia bacterium]